MVSARTEDLEESNKRLQNAIKQVNTLEGLLPICSNCHKIHDDKGYWNDVDTYISDRTNAEFSHSLCPDCTKEMYGKEDWYDKFKDLDKDDLK